MIKYLHRWRYLAGVIAISAIWMPGIPALATTIDVGSNTNVDCTFWCVDRYQEIYSSSLFTGPININTVSFFADGGAWNGVSTWQMILSTSPKTVGHLDSTFANNLGADQTVFDIETFSGFPSIGSLVSFNGAFTYNPTLGNLIVDIQRTAGVAGGVYLEAGTNPGITDRAYSFDSYVTTTDGGANQGGYADRTEFAFSQISEVPEPASILLLGSALIGLGLYRRRKTL